MPRTLIEPHKGDKRYVSRKSGKFTSKCWPLARGGSPEQIKARCEKGRGGSWRPEESLT